MDFAGLSENEIRDRKAEVLDEACRNRAATAADIGMERSLIIFQFGSHALNLDLKGNKSVTMNF